MVFSPVFFNVVEDVLQGHFGEHDSASAVSRRLLLSSGVFPLQSPSLHQNAPPVDGGRGDLGRRRGRDGGHRDGLRGRGGRPLCHALLAARVEAAPAVAVSNAILITAAGGRILVSLLMSTLIAYPLQFCH